MRCTDIFSRQCDPMRFSLHALTPGPCAVQTRNMPIEDASADQLVKMMRGLRSRARLPRGRRYALQREHSHTSPKVKVIMKTEGMGAKTANKKEKWGGKYWKRLVRAGILGRLLYENGF